MQQDEPSMLIGSQSRKRRHRPSETVNIEGFPQFNAASIVTLSGSEVRQFFGMDTEMTPSSISSPQIPPAPCPSMTTIPDQFYYPTDYATSLMSTYTTTDKKMSLTPRSSTATTSNQNYQSSLVPSNSGPAQYEYPTSSTTPINPAGYDEYSTNNSSDYGNNMPSSFPVPSMMNQTPISPLIYSSSFPHPSINSMHQPSLIPSNSWPAQAVVYEYPTSSTSPINPAGYDEYSTNNSSNYGNNIPSPFPVPSLMNQTPIPPLIHSSSFPDPTLNSQMPFIPPSSTATSSNQIVRPSIIHLSRPSSSAGSTSTSKKNKKFEFEGNSQFDRSSLNGHTGPVTLSFPGVYQDVEIDLIVAMRRYTTTPFPAKKSITHFARFILDKIYENDESFGYVTTGVEKSRKGLTLLSPSFANSLAEFWMGHFIVTSNHNQDDVADWMQVTMRDYLDQRRSTLNRKYGDPYKGIQ